MVQFSENINNNILGQNFSNSKLTWSKLFQTEHTRRLVHVPSFYELVFFILIHLFTFLQYGVSNVSSIERKAAKVILVALVRLVSTVYLQVSPQTDCLS